jgi:proprotein convertase subtilisin/kexin type 5
VCIQCENSYFLFSRTGDLPTECVPCTDNDQYVKTPASTGASGVCDLCKNANPFCEECNQVSTSCTKCLAGTFVLNTQRCTECLSSTFFREGGVCKLCYDRISNCIECTQDGAQCTVCAKDHFRYSTGDNGVFDSCVPCTDVNNYVKSGQSTTGTGECSRCQNVNSDCVNCNGDTTTCSQCISGKYLWDNDENSVYESCTTCSGAPTYFRSTNSAGAALCKRCKESISNCAECSADGLTCSKCQSNYFLFDSNSSGSFNSCVPCTGNRYVKNTSATDGSGICKTCAFYVSGCQECSPNGLTCTLCSTSTYLLSGSPDVCSPCSTATYWRNGDSRGTGTCVPCSTTFSGCSECTSLRCTKCATGVLFLVNNGVNSDDCDACSAEDRYVKTGGATNVCEFCSVINPGCIKCDGASSICKKCSMGLYLTNTDADADYETCTECVGATTYISGTADGLGVCASCSSRLTNCLECSKDGTQCLKCNAGSDYLYQSTYKTTAMYDSCVTCNSPTQYQLTQPTASASGKCERCSTAIPNCSQCNNNSAACNVCATNYYLRDLDGNGSYEACDTCALATLYKEGNVCKTCSSKIAKCLECTSTGSACTKCTNGNYLYSSNNDGVFDSCIPCSLATQYVLSGNDQGAGVCTLCVRTDSNCLECSGSPSTCTKCSGVLVRWDPNNDGAYNSCNSCSSNALFKVGSAGTGFCRRCSSSITNCAECNSSGSICTKCNSNNFLHDPSNDSVFTQCVACATTSSQYKSSSSTDGSGICRNCNASISGCAECRNDSSQCYVCTSNLHLFSTDTDYTKNEACLACSSQANHFLIGGNEGDGICRPCNFRFPNCQTCNADQCLTCSGSYKLFLTQNGNNSDDCDLCSALDRSLDTSGNCKYCSVLITNCVHCDSRTNCIRCSPGYYLRSGACVECTESTRYISGEVDGTGSCFDCSSLTSGCAECRRDGSECTKCSGALYLYSGNNNGYYTACVDCTAANTYVLSSASGGNSGVCDHCSNSNAYCLECNSTPASCERCKPNTYLFNSDSDSSNYERCVTCLSKTLYYDTNGVCRRCYEKISNCVECNRDGTQCLKCTSNYYLYNSVASGPYNSCVLCTDPNVYISDTATTGLGVCSRCIAASGSSCYICQGDQNTCSGCGTGLYRWDSNADGDYNQCISCSGSGIFQSGGATGNGRALKLSIIFFLLIKLTFQI